MESYRDRQETASGTAHNREIAVMQPYAFLWEINPSTQLAALNFIREGHSHRHVLRMLRIYQRNMEVSTC